MPISRSDDDTLDEAQDNKKRHIAAKLLLKPGQRVLDIGSGWGGLALYLARVGRCRRHRGHLVGRAAQGRKRTRAQRWASPTGCGFHLRDYREETGRYDRIVSVGMFEHVGVQHYPEFFAKVTRF